LHYSYTCTVYCVLLGVEAGCSCCGISVVVSDTASVVHRLSGRLHQSVYHSVLQQCRIGHAIPTDCRRTGNWLALSRILLFLLLSYAAVFLTVVFCDLLWLPVFHCTVWSVISTHKATPAKSDVSVTRPSSLSRQSSLTAWLQCYSPSVTVIN